MLASLLVVSSPLKIRIAPAGGVTLSSSASLKVMVSALPFTTALTNSGGSASGGVKLVTAWAEKPGTGCIALSASLSLLVPGV